MIISFIFSRFLKAANAEIDAIVKTLMLRGLFDVESLDNLARNVENVA